MLLKTENNQWVNSDHAWKYAVDHSDVDTSKWVIVALMTVAAANGAGVKLAGMYDTQAAAEAGAAKLADKVDHTFDPSTLI